MGENYSRPGAEAREVGLVISGAGRGNREKRFDPSSARPFVEKSLSEHRRRDYHLAITEFFRHAGMKPLGSHPG
jgi:hypothetical protein